MQNDIFVHTSACDRNDNKNTSEVINMSSILVSELKAILEDVPEDYEVIMEIRT